MKLLYLSCHHVLEYDEVKLFHELGIDVFSPGAYIDPNNPGENPRRPSIPGLTYDPEILAEFHRIGQSFPGEDNKNHLPKEFVDKFDAVMVMHRPDWITGNWEAIKHKPIIWRTIGQSVQLVEETIASYRKKGKIIIVRYSPLERTIPGYAGEDAVIRFYKDPAEYGGWVGNEIKVITLAQNMKVRAKFMGYEYFLAATEGLERRLYGPTDPGADTGVPGGYLSFEELQNQLRVSRAYFYTGTAPASYTLNFIEAWMTGTPIVALGRELGIIKDFRDVPTYEVDRIIENGITGYTGNTISELKSKIKLLFNDWDHARQISQAAREVAIAVFGKEKIKPEWKAFFESL